MISSVEAEQCAARQTSWVQLVDGRGRTEESSRQLFRQSDTLWRWTKLDGERGALGSLKAEHIIFR